MPINTAPPGRAILHLHHRVLKHGHGNRACGDAGNGYIAFMLPDEQTSPEQIAVFRAMTGVRRLRLAEQLYWSARKIKASGLRQQHPDWPASRVNDEVRRIFSHART